MIDLAQRALPAEVSLSCAECGRAPYADGSMDAVLLFGLLTCLIEPADERAAPAEAARLLQPGGWLFVNDFLLGDDRARYLVSRDEFGEYGLFTVDGRVRLKHMSTARLRARLADF